MNKVFVEQYSSHKDHLSLKFHPIIAYIIHLASYLFTHYFLVSTMCTKYTIQDIVLKEQHLFNI